MYIFLDTTDVDAIKKYRELGLIDGVTTNPSLIANGEIHNREKLVADIVALDLPSVSIEMLAEDCQGMLDEAKPFLKLGDAVTIKLPMTEEGIKACRILSDQGVQVNITLCFTVAQAIIAAKAGATYVSPFIGRSEDHGYDGLQLLQDIVTAYDNYDFETMVLAASLRNTYQITQASLIGVDIVTLPPKLLGQMFDNPLTTAGQQQFLHDAKNAVE